MVNRLNNRLNLEVDFVVSIKRGQNFMLQEKGHRVCFGKMERQRKIISILFMLCTYSFFFTIRLLNDIARVVKNCLFYEFTVDNLM